MSTEIIEIKRENNLPVRLKDLRKFVLIGREKLIAVRAEMRAIDKKRILEYSPLLNFIRCDGCLRA